MDLLAISSLARRALLSVGLLALGASSRAVAQDRTLRDSALVESDGARLFVDLRAADSTAPVLLVLHGGPGQVVSGLWSFMAYNGPGLERRLVVAYLNQRGLAKSSRVAPETQTVAQHVRDVDAVVRYLQGRFHQPRIHLMGHSWGAFLGWTYLAAHPDRVGRFVAVAGGPNFLAAERIAYQQAKAWAAKTRNDSAGRALAAIGPPPYRDLDQLFVERRWSAAAYGNPDLSKSLDMKRVIAAAGYATPDPAWDAAGIAVATRMLPELWNLNVEPALATLRTPVLSIAGGRDAIVVAEGLRRAYAAYRGPKQYLVFERGTHFLFAEEPDRFNRAVVEFLTGR